MQFKEIGEPEKSQYDEFVAANPSGSFLQSWQWGEWQSALGRQVKRFKLQVESGETKGVIQLIRMPLPFGKDYWYAPYGPVLAGGEQLKVESEKLKVLIFQLKLKLSNAVFVRIEPKGPLNFKLETLNLPITKSANIQPAKTLIINLPKTEEELLGEMHTKTRYNIKVAQKHGVEIKDEFDITIGHGLFAKEAVELIVKTSQRQGFKGYGMDYYNKMIDSLAVQSRGMLKLHIYKAIHKNELLASAIMLDFGKTRTFLFGGSSDGNKNLMAPYLLHWQAMLDAKSQGLDFYDFWGIETSSGETPGFVRFKLGFGGSAVEYAGAYDIIENKMAYKTYLLLRHLNTITKKLRL